MRQHSLRRLTGMGASAGILHALFFISSNGVALAPSALGAEPMAQTASARPSAGDLQRWVRELDDEAYPVREAATKQLIQAGSAAVDSLAAAVLSDSAEVSWRASDALTRIARHADEATLERVSDALHRLSSTRPSFGKLASEVKTLQRNFRHTRAVAKIRGLGGNLSGHWHGEDEPALAGLEMAVVPLIVMEEEEIEVPAAIEVEEEARPAPRGLMGLLARLIVPELAPPVPLEPVEAIPADLKPVDAIGPEADSVIRRLEAPALPEAPAVEVARAVPALIPPPAPILEEIPLVEVAPAVAEAEVAEAVEVVFDAGLIGPAVIFDEPFSPDNEDYAELVLNKSFRGTDADLAVLKDIPELYNLTISGAKLTDKALVHIAALPGLTRLEISGTEMSSAALRNLRAKRPELSVLCRSAAMLGINSGLEGPCILTSVFYRSGAYEAGLKDGDEITEVDGQKVRDFSDLTIAVYPHKAGEKLKVKYKRNGEDRETLVTLKPRNVVEATE